MSIVLENASYSFRLNDGCLVPALCDVTLEINDGEFVGIMGHTGCGKTTLLQLMTGLLTPTSGRVLLDGSDINAKDYDRNELRKNIGLVFQFPEYQLFESTVEKDVAFALKNSALSQGEVKERVKWALETMEFSFEAIRTQAPLSLSGGEKRRVAIAGALVTKPRFLIFDEPIAGLDPQSRQSFLQTVTSLNSKGTAIIMISHNTDALGECAKRLLVIDGGSLVIDGGMKDVFSDSKRLTALHLNAGTPRAIGDMLSSYGVTVPQTVTSYAELLCVLKLRLAGNGCDD